MSAFYDFFLYICIQAPKLVISVCNIIGISSDFRKWTVYLEALNNFLKV